MTRFSIKAIYDRRVFGARIWAKNALQAKEIFYTLFGGSKILGVSVDNNYILGLITENVPYEYSEKLQIKTYEISYMLEHPKLGKIRRFARVKALNLCEAKVLANDWFAELGWKAVETDSKIGYDHEFININ